MTESANFLAEVTFLDEVPTPMLVADEQSGIIEYFNQAAVTFFNLPPRKLRHQKISAVVRYKNGDVTADMNEAIKANALITTGEIVVMVGEDAREVVLRFVPKVVKNSAKIVVVSIQDFSVERILHQKHRLQLDELKKKNLEIKQYSEGLEALVEVRTDELQSAMEQSEALLLNILPKPIAERLKKGESTIADRFNMVSVLFADIVGFTPMASAMDPAALVQILGAIFDEFDHIIELSGVEKIKTIGDSYLAVAGIPFSDPLHAEKLCDVALAMRSKIKEINEQHSLTLAVRFGIHSGPVVAGVIGKKKFAYDLWGDTVNIASRMESHGEVNEIQVSEATYHLIKETFTCSERGEIQVKGKGALKVYWVKSRAN